MSGYFFGFRIVRSKFQQNRNMFSPMNMEFDRIILSNNEVKSMGDFLIFLRHGIADLETYVLDGIISVGEFLTYDLNTERLVTNDFDKALRDYCHEFRRLKRCLDSDLLDRQNSMIENARGFHEENYEFSIYDLVLLNEIYEREENILSLTIYILDCIESRQRDISYPLLLKGFVDVGRPSEADVLEELHFSESVRS